VHLKKYFIWSTLLSFAGVIFAGYLTGIKLFNQICAFGETCPYFFGYPACYFGLGFFLLLFIISAGSLATKIKSKIPAKMILTISFGGIIFAGNFVVQEFIQMFNVGFKLYGLGLPTCFYGMVFYILIFALSLEALRYKK